MDRRRRSRRWRKKMTTKRRDILSRMKNKKVKRRMREKGPGEGLERNIKKRRMRRRRCRRKDEKQEEEEEGI
ncbi:hypothetical protein EYF80_065570 [Liparis tanakae]|uniref:Uncharacterized protein n=1 Tax=Liparis tanakae TaxID=230148 RepID=A0A4Z2E6C6_9TELE|nr:hypothetical protein EYF80_065570 [Liparis tanakae]